MSMRSYQGTSPIIGQGVYLDPSAVVIGDVVLEDEVSIWPGVVVRGDVNYIRIGARTNIQDNSVIHVSHAGEIHSSGYPTLIGADVTVGHKVMLHGCVVADRVLVGMGSTILDGVRVQSDVIIGAGSLVPQNRELESGYLYLGSPAKKVRQLSDREVASLRYSANHYVKLKNLYIAEDYQA